MVTVLAPLALLLSAPRTLEVYAAVSLREAFRGVARAFERTHPGVAVRLTFSGSQTLAAQIQNGAPADVFASAAPKNLRNLAYDPSSRRVFATNRLVLLGKKDLRSLASARRIVLAAPFVPAGGYTGQALTQAGKRFGATWLASVRSHIVSQENDVRTVLAKFRLGEADAAIVYATDAKGTPLPRPFQPRIEYPVVRLTEAPEPSLAKEFIGLLLSPVGKRCLKARGFGVP
ncbi:molybdate ABC transporter substrate-binding protein [bacterium]|nr:MAG: molybdate ABC transporter substrate-binding protein [bacterium]